MIKPQLRRIYVLLWVLWGFWCLYWPIYNQDQQANNLRRRNLEVFKSCLDSDPNREHCWKAREKAEEDLEKSEVSPYGEWKIAIPFLAGLILIPPLILYGLLFRVVPCLVRVVWEGWKGEKAPTPQGGRKREGWKKSKSQPSQQSSPSLDGS